MEFTFSIRHVATLVYAFAALDRCNGDADSFIEVLCPDRYDALKTAILSAMSELPLRLPGRFTEVVIPADDSDDLARFIMGDNVSNSPEIVSLRPALERWLAYTTLAVIHSGADDGRVAERYSDAADRIIAMLGNAFDTPDDMIGAVVAHRY